MDDVTWMKLVDLSEVPPAAEAFFGGKACGLARLIAAGATVPPGFALQAAELPLDGWTSTDLDEFGRRVAAMTRIGPLAVRSSAVGEDGADRSFAGMFETFLDVMDVDEALAAARRCVESARSPRVRAYANGGTLPAVGVVVQSQVAARAAGVCFTADPAGQDGAVVIEAVAGTGDRLVSGQAQPQRWRVYRSGLGQWEVRRDSTSIEQQVVGDDEVIRIAEQGTQYAEKFGHPLDLEWAVAVDGQLWWLQARPITAAPPSLRVEISRAFDCGCHRRGHEFRLDLARASG